MMPDGLIGACLLLSLIPGWLFLRRSESERQPRDQTALHELLQLVGVGLLTTGLAAALALLVNPRLLLDHDGPLTTSGEVRAAVGLLVGLLVLSIALAEIAVQLLRLTSKTPNARLTVSVWWASLRPELVPEGKLPWAVVALKDGSTLEGVLSDYTLSAESSHRDIALRAPIRATIAGETKSTPYKVTLVLADDIRHVSVAYVDR